MNSSSAPQSSAVAPKDGAPAARPTFPFVLLFFPWLLIAITTILVTSILPESYCSTARIKIERDQSDILGLAERRGVADDDPHYIQTEFELIQSEAILGKVVEGLDLNIGWGKKYAGGERLKTSESISLLKARVDLRPVRNTSIAEIRAYSEKADEAAKIADAVAEAYRDYRVKARAGKISASIQALEQAYEENNQKIRTIRTEIAELSREPSAQNTNRLDEGRSRLEELQRFSQVLFTKLANEKTDLSLPATGMVQIVDRAVPAYRPVRPNKPCNMLIGIVVGCLVGCFLATLVYVLQCREFRRKSGVPRTPFPPRFRAAVHIFIALVVGVVVGYRCASPFDAATVIIVPLTIALGGIASAYLELANPGSPSATAL